MKKTISQTVIEEMEAKGYTFVGQTKGTHSFRKGSNLSRYVDRLGLSESEVEVRNGARAGKNLNDGYQLLVFKK